MKTPDGSDDLNKPRELGPSEVENLFLISPIIDRARITVAHPIGGMLIQDRSGALYLTRELDYQARDEAAIPLKGVAPESSAGLLGSPVKIAGTFDKSTGITVEMIAASEGTF